MKKNLLSLVLGLLALACTEKQAPDYLLFYGKIDNLQGNTLQISTPAMITAARLQVDTAGRFADTLRLPAGYYYLEYAGEYTPLYLQPGRNVDLYLNTSEFDESIQYNGPGAPENNYLAAKFLLNESMERANNPYRLFTLDEPAFLALTDSIYNILLQNLVKYRPQLDSTFTWLEGQQLYYDKLEKISSYPGMRRYLTQDTAFRVPDGFPRPLDSLNLTDSRLARVPNYISLLESWAGRQLESGDLPAATDPLLYYARFIRDNLADTLIRERLAATLIDYLSMTSQLDSLYRITRAMLYDTLLVNGLEQAYQSLQRVRPGQPSPGFAFVNLQGDTVSLQDLRGQPVYIDVWATWCAPCIDEIPHLKKLQAELQDHPIHFVSICVDDRKESWQKLVRQENLAGIHLFAPTLQHPFFRAYQISGIPHFILIDAAGRIIEASAKRPSNPHLTEQLKNLLENVLKG